MKRNDFRIGKFVKKVSTGDKNKHEFANRYNFDNGDFIDIVTDDFSIEILSFRIVVSQGEDKILILGKWEIFE